MTTENEKFRSDLVAAVQAELERHASVVIAEVDRLRDEARRERDQLRAEFTEQLGRLTQTVEQLDLKGRDQAEAARAAFEKRLEESEKRQARRVEDATAGLDRAVQEAARPVLADLRSENQVLSDRVTSLDANLRKFDEQAARMVTYFSDVTQQVEQRQDELSETLRNDVAAQMATLQQLVDDNDSAVRKFQNEVGQQVTSKLNDAEDRFNARLLATEERVKDEAGQKIAEIDLHVSRVSNNLDESLGVMNDRIAAIDDRLVAIDRQIRDVEASVDGIDQNALDEMRQKMSTAAGEAMLVRIEMERLEKAVNERSDTLAVRLTDVEASLQDATLDVSTSVQLDRLEELERAIAELDPDQFVRRDGQASSPSATAPPSSLGGGDEFESTGPPTPPSGMPREVRPGTRADRAPSAPDGIDIGAIIAAAEADGEPRTDGI